MHEHNHCHHELKHCSICNVVYCTKCGKEWGGTNWYPYYPPLQPYTPYWTTTGDIKFIDGTTTNHTHQ